MIVAELMSKTPFTIYPDAPVTEAQSLMRREKIHRLPVCDHRGTLVGIISEKDLLNVSPSVATTLDMYEMTNLLSKLKVEKVMKKPVLTVQEDTLVEDAARLMADHDIGGVPVVRKDNTVVGIVTDSDIFHFFIEMFGTRRKGLRMSLLLEDKAGKIATLTSAIAAAGGNIIAIGTTPGTNTSNIKCMIKLEGLTRDALLAALKPLELEIEDVREV